MTLIIIIFFGLSIVNFVGLIIEIKDRARDVGDVYAFIVKNISQVYEDLR